MTIKHLFPPVWPKVDFNFAATRQLDPRITFTRDSIGSYVDAQRTIRYAAEGEPRFDHDPETGKSLGLLIEESRTNLITNSTDLTGWSTVTLGDGVTPTSANVTDTAPDNSTSVTKVTLSRTTATTSNYSIYRVSATHASAVTTGSIYVKAFSASDVGKVVDVYNNQGSPIDFQTVTLTDEWQRITSVGPSPSTQSFLNVALFNSSASTGTVNVLIWGAQSEQGAFPTSLIPTSGATADRSADAATITGDNLTSWFDGNAGSVFSVASSLQTVDYSTNNLVWHFRDPGRKEHNSAKGFQFFDTFTGGSYAKNGTSYLNGVPRKAVYAFGEGEAVAAIDGTLLGKITNWLPTAHTSLSLGSNVGFNLFLNGHIYRFACYPRRLSDEQLVSLTS